MVAKKCRNKYQRKVNLNKVSAWEKNKLETPRFTFSSHLFQKERLEPTPLFPEDSAVLRVVRAIQSKFQT